MASQNKDSTRVAAGLKATIHNPRVSDEAKSNAQERLQGMGTSADAPANKVKSSNINDDDEEFTPGETGDLTQQQLGGFKATRKNPNVSSEAKQHAEEILDAHGQA